MSTGSASTGHGPWRSEAIELLRAVSGGLLFGVPLLYTMEIWWVGTQIEPEQMLILLGSLAIALLALNLTAGFRTSRDVRLGDALGDMVEAIAIGLIITAAVLVMLREVTPDMPLGAALGKVLYESVPFCLGIGVARFLLSGDPGMTDEGDGSGSGDERTSALNASAADLGATVVGAAFIGLSIAPTDEVPMLASAMGPGWQLVVVATSLVASYLIVFVAGFSRQSERHAQEGIFQRPGVETIVTYLLALVVAVGLLWIFQQDGGTPSALLSQAIVLGFPAAIGGAAGRLAL